MGDNGCRELRAYWSSFTRQQPRVPYLHPKDCQYLDSIGYWAKHPNAREKLNFDKYLRSRRFGRKDDEFHFSLRPAPYIGDLANATVFILLLNPGFAHIDYYSEYARPGYRKLLDKNLAQDFRGVKFRYIHLDPAFCWAGGFRWWESKLRSLLWEVAEKRFSGNYYRTLRFASRRLASIELIPYHSANFRKGSLIKNLPSAQVALRAATSLERRARKGEVVVVVTRKASDWGLTQFRDQVVCYEGGEARGAHLTPNTKGGQAILKKLLRDTDGS